MQGRVGFGVRGLVPAIKNGEEVDNNMAKGVFPSNIQLHTPLLLNVPSIVYSYTRRLWKIEY